MPVRLHKDGFILGGLCPRRLSDRAWREDGAWSAWADAQSQGCFEATNGWLRMVKNVKRRKLGEYGGGNREIGFSRMRQQVFSQLLDTGKPFRRGTMELWITDIARLEFGVDADTPLGSFKFSLVEPKGEDDVLYEQGHAASFGREVARNERGRIR